MIVYHGSYVAVAKPDILYSRDNVDFGKGFYTTPIYEQAVSWSSRFKRINGLSVVSSYNIDAALWEHAAVLKFDSYSDDWLDFIMSCRRGGDDSRYDVVIGGVANDKVFDTLQLFFDGLIDKSESIRRMRYDKPNIQYCFRNQDIIDKYLIFKSGEVIQ